MAEYNTTPDENSIVEEILKKKRLSKECKLWLLSRMRGARGDIVPNKNGSYEQFLKNYGPDLFKGVRCMSRLPGGRYCDIIPGKAIEISVVGCTKCKNRITDMSIEECIKEDEYCEPEFVPIFNNTGM